jgi:hypothetical protein
MDNLAPTFARLIPVIGHPRLTRRITILWRSFAAWRSAHAGAARKRKRVAIAVLGARLAEV